MWEEECDTSFAHAHSALFLPATQRRLSFPKSPCSPSSDPYMDVMPTCMRYRQSTASPRNNIRTVIKQGLEVFTEGRIGKEMRRQEQICGQDHSASSFLSPYHTLKMQEWSILIAAVAQPDYVLTFIIIAGGFGVTRFSQGGLVNPAFLKAFPDARWLKRK